jgi:hypothetical protein
MKVRNICWIKTNKDEFLLYLIRLKRFFKFTHEHYADKIDIYLYCINYSHKQTISNLILLTNNGNFIRIS